MGVDLSVFGNLKTKADYDRAETEFYLKKLMAQKSITGSTPAALKIADAIQKARASGDTTLLNDIVASGKLLDRGVTYDDEGNPVAMPGYAPAVASIEGAKAGAKRQAEQDVNLVMEPQIANDVETQKVLGKEAGDASVAAIDLESTYPSLMDTVGKLSKLGKTATYTLAGRGVDVARKEAGMDPRQQAVDRTAYISYVDNSVLPLLRQTFGAQFTAKEGQDLKVTLGDPNKTPEEKDAVLRSFIDNKAKSIDVAKRKAAALANAGAGGAGTPMNGDPTMPPAFPTNVDPSTGDTIPMPPMPPDDATAAVPQAPAKPKIGAIDVDDNGVAWRFMGGDPANPKSWKKN
jgi:hypothetical protein